MNLRDKEHVNMLIACMVLLAVAGSIAGMLSISLQDNVEDDILLDTLPGSLPCDSSAPGSSDKAGDEWPMYHGALNHTGVTTTTMTQGTGPKWTYRMGGMPYSIPAISAGRVYMGNLDFKVYCLDAGTGASIWNYTTGAMIFSSPAVAGNAVYVGSNDHKIYCIDATFGTLNWSYTTGSYVASSPAVAGGRVYVGSDDHNLYCLNATNGVSLWNFTTGGLVRSSPAIVGGWVYVGCYDHNVYCLNAVTGTLNWTYSTSNIISYSSPAISNNRVYVGSYDHQVHCLNATDGSCLWSSSTGDAVDSTPAVANGYVYAGSNDYKMYCFNAITGKSIWNFTTDNLIYTSPVIVGTRLYFTCANDHIYCLNALTGGLVWSYMGPVFSPAIANGYIFVCTGSMYNAIYCLPMEVTPSAIQFFYANSGFGQVTLSWQEPAQGGATNYRIYRGTTSNGETLLATIGNVHAYTINGGTIGQPYYFKVAAVNGIDTGQNSTERCQTPIFWDPIVTEGNAQVTINWTQPADYWGSALTITGYRIYCGTMLGYETFLVDVGAVFTYTCTGLTNGKMYYFKVGAINAFGAITNSSSSMCVPKTTPSAPQSFTATAGIGQVVLNWAAPASNGGRTITGYRVYGGITPGGETMLTTLGVQLNYTASGLTGGQVYYFKVAAINSVGPGANTTEAIATSIGIPGAPRTLVATAGDAQVILTWTIPTSNGGSAITGYKVYRGTSSGNATLLATIGNVTTWTDTGVTNGQAYYYKVIAVNGIGEGLASTESSATPMSKPTTPGTPTSPNDSITIVIASVGIIGGIVAVIAIVVLIRRKARTKRT